MCIDFVVVVCVCVCVCVCDFLYCFNIVYFGEIQHVDNKNKKHETNMNLFPQNVKNSTYLDGTQESMII